MIFDIAAIVEQPKEQDKENPEDDTRKNLAFLLEKVEGCSVSRFSNSSDRVVYFLFFISL